MDGRVGFVLGIHVLHFISLEYREFSVYIRNLNLLPIEVLLSMTIMNAITVFNNKPDKSEKTSQSSVEKFQIYL